MNKKCDQAPDAVAIDGWWNAVLAGGVDEPHPVYGDDLTISIRHGVLRLVGVLPAEADRQELLARAGSFVGHGLDKVDAKHLKVAERKDKPGILEQTVISAFRNPAVAQLARDYLVGIRRLKVEQLDILDRLDRGQDDTVRRLIPQEFVSDALKALESGEALLVVRVDETEAFKVREMLAEDTRSRRTISTPPVPIADRP